MNLLIAVLLCVLVLYAWAAVIFLYFRFSGPETPGRQRRFLERYDSFFTQRIFSQTKMEMTRQTIRTAGRRGWNMVPLPLFLFSHTLSSTDILLSIAVLFFGGLMVAYSWYGQRCLRMLGLDILPRSINLQK